MKFANRYLGANAFIHDASVIDAAFHKLAIREIKADGLIFFTQKRTRKVTEMNACPEITLTFWYERTRNGRKYVSVVTLRHLESLLTTNRF